MLSSDPDRKVHSRRRGARRAAVITTAVLAAAAATSGTALAAQAAGSAGPAWHIVKQVHNGPFGGFTAVTAIGKNGGWAFNQGSVPTAWRRSGSTWTQVRFPGTANEVVVAAGATSADDAWAFTAGGAQSRALRWNGRAWTVQRSFSQQIGGAVVISPSDIWVFGQPYFPGTGLGAWHYNGSTWSRVSSGRGLEGGSALSGSDIWAVDGVDVAHWNGSTWTRTSLAHLLPAKQPLNGPLLTGVFAQSKNSVYAIGNGGLEDDGGPLVILHWNGRQWTKVAAGNYGFGVQPMQQVSSDGHGGLWLPMPGVDGQPSYLLHYAAGRLTQAALPDGEHKMSVEAVALIPGTTDVLGGGDTHAANTPGTNVTAVVLEYSS